MSVLAKYANSPTIDTELTRLGELIKVDPLCLNPQEQFAWLTSMGGGLDAVISMTEFTMWAECEVLYTVKKVFPLFYPEVRELFNDDFYQWATRYSSRRTKPQSVSTVDNKIMVFKAWVAERTIAVPETVTLPKEVVTGSQRDVGSVIEVEFDVTETEYAKALTATGKARKGQMTEADWSALRNPEVTWTRFDNQIKIGSNPEPTNNSSGFRVFYQDGLLFASVHGEAQPIMSIGEITSPLVRRGVNYILKAVGLKPVDSTVVMEVPQEPLVIKTGDEVVVRLTGGSVFSLSEAVAQQIARKILDL